MMRSTVIEPGIVPLFRLFAIGRFALVAALALAWLLSGRGVLTPIGFADLGVAGLLLLYLLWPGLPERLGPAFLPIGLGIAVLGPIVTQPGVFQAWTTSLAVNRDGLISVVRPIPSLLVLTVIIAWQYDMRRLWLFSFGVAALDIIWYMWSSPVDRPVLPLFGGMIILRIIALPLVGYVVVRLIAVQRAQRQSLTEANARLAHYAATLEQLTISRERNRLARELHDTLAHTLSGLAVQLEAVRSLWERDQDGARGLLDASLAATRAGLSEARRALQALRAAPLEDLGLPLALRRLAETTADRTGVALDLRLPDRALELPPDIEQCIYRVAQEALENVARHAQATHVAVHLEHDGRQVALLVRDDGQGYDPALADAEQRLGLRGMRERARLVGGRLELTSQPGACATVRLIVGAGHDSRADL
jgi:signal transduction histidine kinase